MNHKTLYLLKNAFIGHNLVWIVWNHHHHHHHHHHHLRFFWGPSSLLLLKVFPLLFQHFQRLSAIGDIRGKHANVSCHPWDGSLGWTSGGCRQEILHQIVSLGGGNSNRFYFHPGSLWKWSNLTVAYFWNGLKPPTRSSSPHHCHWFLAGSTESEDWDLFFEAIWAI